MERATATTFSTCGHGDELNGDLPPFYELPAIISAATNEARAPEGVLPAWRKLHASGLRSSRV